MQVCEIGLHVGLYPKTPYSLTPLIGDPLPFRLTPNPNPFSPRTFTCVLAESYTP